MTPGYHLRLELKRLALNQKAFAATLGISRQTINNIINGRQQISRPLARKLGAITGKASDYWLRDSYPDRAIAKTAVKPIARKLAKPKRQPGPIKFYAFVTKNARGDLNAQLIEKIISDQKLRCIASWASFRFLLVRNGASDDDLVSARAIWKRYAEQMLKPTARSSIG